jgi:ribosomal protein S18 acetylase RimI-like enzyme
VKLELRKYVPKDFDTLYQIDLKCYPPEVAYSRRDLHIYLRLPGAECIVAEDSGAAIGFCLTSHRGAQGYIVTIDVLESHRRKHVGSAILAESERRLAVSGIREVTLETAVDTESAVAFWLKHGYRKLGLKKGYYPGGRDAFAMVKRLA